MAEVYAIAVRIALQNNVSSGLKVIAKDLLGLNGAVDGLQRKFGRLHVALFGAGMVAAGLGFLDIFKGLAEAGGAVVNQQAKMAQLGISNRDIARETAEAYANIGISGTTIAGNMAAALKLRTIFGGSGFQETNLALPAFLKAQFALQGAGIDPASIEDFIKPLDVMGAFRTGNKLDPAKFGPAIQMAVSAVLSSGGLLTGVAFQRAIQLAGPAAAQMGEQTFFNTMLEPLLALGNKAARGLQYGGSTFIGGQMSKASAHMLDRLGLTHAGDYTHEGGRWTLDQGKIAGSKLLAKGDIIDWISKYFLPDAAKAGLNPMVAAASLPQTLQALISTVYEIGPQIAKSIAQQAQANAANPYTAAQAAWSGASGNLEDALTGLWQALGVPAAGMAVTVMNKLADAIRNFTAWVGNHQTAVTTAEKIMGGLGVALAALGTVALAGALAGMVGTGGTLVLLAGALGGLGLALKGIPGALDTINHDLQKFVYDLLHPSTWISGPGTPAPGSPHRGPTPLAQPYSGPGAVDTLESGAHNAVKKIGDWIDQGAPVAVTNPGAIGKAATGLAIDHMTRGLQAPQTGSSTANYRHTRSGSAANAAR